MKPIYLSIQQQETGENIRRLLKTNGYTVKDVQEVMGFENPQAVYKLSLIHIYASFAYRKKERDI